MIDIAMKPSAYQSADRVLSIEYPANGELRSRIVISRSKSRPTGKYPSWKMGRPIFWESPHELNACRHLDATPSVVGFGEQPMVIRYILNNVEHLHYPDFLVDFEKSKEIWEIKLATEAAIADVAARTQLLQNELPRMGFTYRMVFGEYLAKEPRLSNELKLLKYGRAQVSIVEYEKVRHLFLGDREVTWASAQESLGAERSRLLSRLFLTGCITFDIEKELQPNTQFSWVGLPWGAM